jgi:hypothetical protein
VTENTPFPVEHIHEDHDSSTLAGHHTLGTGRFQLSPGNHNHSKSDPNSVPLFNGIEVVIDPTDPQDQINKIWDLVGNYGVTIVPGGFIPPWTWPGGTFYTPVYSRCATRPITEIYWDAEADGYSIPMPPSVMPGDMVVGAYTFRWQGTYEGLCPGGDPIDVWGHSVSFGGGANPVVAGYTSNPTDFSPNVWYYDGRETIELNTNASQLRVRLLFLPNVYDISLSEEMYLIQPYTGDGDTYQINQMSWSFNGVDASTTVFPGQQFSDNWLPIYINTIESPDFFDAYRVRLGAYRQSVDLKGGIIAIPDSAKDATYAPHPSVTDNVYFLDDSRVGISRAGLDYEFDPYWESFGYVIPYNCSQLIVPSSVRIDNSVSFDISGSWDNPLDDSNPIYWRTGEFIASANFGLVRVAEVDSPDWFENASVLVRLANMDTQYCFTRIRFTDANSFFIYKSLDTHPDSTSLSQTFLNHRAIGSAWTETQKNQVYAAYTSVPVGAITPLEIQLTAEGDNTSGIYVSYIALERVGP